MNEQEAIEIIIALYENGMVDLVMADKITAALEKQVAKKIRIDENGWWECPNHCTLDGLISNNFQYCPYCGQKLDWGDAE